MHGEHERNHAHSLWLQFPWLWAIQPKWAFGSGTTKVKVHRGAKKLKDFLAEYPRCDGQHVYVYTSEVLPGECYRGEAVSRVEVTHRNNLDVNPWADALKWHLNATLSENAIQAIADKGREKIGGSCDITIYLPPRGTTLKSFIRRALARLEAQSA